MLSPPPARAAHWVVTYACTGKIREPGASSDFDWWPTPAGQNPVYYASGGAINATTGSSIGTMTATLTWTPSFQGDMEGPPSRFVYKENGYAAARYSTGGSCSTSVGFGDPQVTSDATSQSTASMLTTVYDNHDLRTVITLPERSFSAVATLGPTGGQAFASVGYIVATFPPHEHPINFRRASADTSIGGVLKVTYWWDSTSGKTMPNEQPTDLGQCHLWEHVTYSGDGSNYQDGNGSTFFQPVIPPFSAAWGPHLPQPTDAEGGTMQTGQADDRHELPTRVDGSFTFPYGPAGPASYQALQIYRFHCDVCMATGEYQRLYGPTTIDERVESVFGTLYAPWQFRITKESDTCVLYLGGS